MLLVMQLKGHHSHLMLVLHQIGGFVPVVVLDSHHNTHIHRTDLHMHHTKVEWDLEEWLRHDYCCYN